MIPDYEEQEIELRKKIVKRQDRNAENLFAETEWLLKKKKKKNEQKKEMIPYVFDHIIPFAL